MRTTLNLSDDALLIAKQIAARDHLSLGEAVSRLARAGAAATPIAEARALPLRGRFAMLPRRDDVITPEHVRELMEREGI